LLGHTADFKSSFFKNLIAKLRDLGDFITEMHAVNQRNTTSCAAPQFKNKECTQPIAIAHFLSLYQIVFMLIIAKREQKREIWNPEALCKSFTLACVR